MGRQEGRSYILSLTVSSVDVLTLAPHRSMRRSRASSPMAAAARTEQINCVIFSASANNSHLGNLIADASLSVASLKQRILREVLAPAGIRLSTVVRVRLSLRQDPKREPLKDDSVLRTLITHYPTDGRATLELTFKDLGPQVSYQQVFLAEYAGPLLFYTAVFGGVAILAPHKIQGLQIRLFALWALHYIKRIYETLYVHRFSHGANRIPNL